MLIAINNDINVSRLVNKIPIYTEAVLVGRNKMRD